MRSARPSADRKYGCDQCDKKFFTRKDVKRHSIVHTRDRNFACDRCQARFGRKDHLVRHSKKSCTSLTLARTSNSSLAVSISALTRTAKRQQKATFLSHSIEASKINSTYQESAVRPTTNIESQLQIQQQQQLLEQQHLFQQHRYQQQQHQSQGPQQHISQHTQQSAQNQQDHGHIESSLAEIDCVRNSADTILPPALYDTGYDCTLHHNATCPRNPMQPSNVHHEYTTSIGRQTSVTVNHQFNVYNHHHYEPYTMHVNSFVDDCQLSDTNFECIYAGSNYSNYQSPSEHCGLQETYISAEQYQY